MIDLSPICQAIANFFAFVAGATHCHALDCMQNGFMQMALLGLLLLAPMAAAMGVQVVNFRMAFFSDAISHSAFAGVAIGLLLRLDVHWTMVALALVIGLAITGVGRRLSLSTDTVIGVFLAAVVAFGLVIVSRERHITREVNMFLFGDILTIGSREILWESLLFVALVAFQVIGYNRMLYVGLNPVLATAHRVRTRFYQYTYAALLALVAIFAVWAVGVFLVTALLIVPAATARNLARSAGGMFWWAIVVGLTSAVAGLILSAQDWAHAATGASVVLVAVAWFAASCVVAATRCPGKR